MAQENSLGIAQHLGRVRNVHYPDSLDMSGPEDDNTSVNSDNSRMSVKCSGDVHSDYSVATSIFEAGEQEMKELRLRLAKTEEKCALLDVENEKIQTQLVNEKKKTSKLEKKLQFVKDNQEVFMRLKEAYINMKYNEAAGRKMIEIREKGMQTWQGVLCKACIETEEIRRQVDLLLEKYSDLFVISPGEMERLLNTVKYLKDLIDRREKSWSVNVERECKLREHIAVLERECETLRELVHNKRDDRQLLEEEQIEDDLIQEKKLEETQKNLETITKDVDKLKKIVVKYEKNFREITQAYPAQIFNHPLSDKERKMVRQMITTNGSKNSSKIRSRSLSINKPQQPHRPSSPFRGQSRQPRGEYSDFRPESAILMMDCLFD